MFVQFSKSFYTGNWFRSARQKCRQKKSIGFSKWSTCFNGKKEKSRRKFWSCIIHEKHYLLSCMDTIQGQLLCIPPWIPSHHQESKAIWKKDGLEISWFQNIKCIKVHFMLCIYILKAGLWEFITWLLQRTERRSENHRFWAICNAGEILVLFFIQFVT